MFLCLTAHSSGCTAAHVGLALGEEMEDQVLCWGEGCRIHRSVEDWRHMGWGLMRPSGPTPELPEPGGHVISEDIPVIQGVSVSYGMPRPKQIVSLKSVAESYQ